MILIKRIIKNERGCIITSVRMSLALSRITNFAKTNEVYCKKSAEKRQIYVFRPKLIPKLKLYSKTGKSTIKSNDKKKYTKMNVKFFCLNANNVTGVVEDATPKRYKPPR